MVDKIFIVGYMGSGKTVIGNLIAQKLKIPFYDLDNLIEKRLEMSISEIFQQKGEIYFRKVEHQIFTELAENDAAFVLSLGGGTPCYANNHLLLSGKNRTSVYLNASIDILSDRLLLDRTFRSLIADLSSEEFKEYIAKHLFDRSFFYNQAVYKVKVNDKTPDEVTDEVIALLT